MKFLVEKTWKFKKQCTFALIFHWYDMTKGKEKVAKADSRNKAESSKYINPLTDFEFKYIFGTKELLIDFLNGIVDVEGGIVDLTYDNTERIPHSDEERSARFDLHCVTGTDDRIIIEMQNISQTFFKDRTLYYVTFPVQEQAPKSKNWDFMLKPIYSVNILNFRMKDEEQQEPAVEEPNELQQPDKPEFANKYITYVQLIDRDTHEVFYKKLTMVYLELPLFTVPENELKTGKDKWTYVLKNLSELNELPEALRNEVFEKLFQMAEIAKLSAKERKEYYRSLKSFRDMYNSIAQRDQVIATLKQEVKTFRKENAAKDKMIAALQRQLRKNEKNFN